MFKKKQDEKSQEQSRMDLIFALPCCNEWDSNAYPLKNNEKTEFQVC